MKISDIDNVAKDDIITKQNIFNTRKPKLMLSHLNKLKKMRELDSLERIVQDEQIGIMFGSSSAEETPEF